MRLRDLYSFRVARSVVESALNALNEELERAGSGYRYAYGRAYDRPYLYVCRAEYFDKETQHCRIIDEQRSFSTNQDLLNAIQMIRYAVKKT
jgi:hypothetical protein